MERTKLDGDEEEVLKKEDVQEQVGLETKLDGDEGWVRCVYPRSQTS